MHYQQLINALKNKIGLIKYHENNTIYSKFFTFNQDCETQSSKNHIVCFNMITEAFEAFQASEVMYVSFGSLQVNSSLWSAFLNSKRKYENIKNLCSEVNLDFNVVTTNLTNQVDMVFGNTISLDLFSSFVQTKMLLYGNHANFTDVLGIVSCAGPSILSCLFETQTLNFIEFKQHYKRLLNARATKELDDIKSEWARVAFTFPEITSNEINDVSVMLNKIVENTIHKFDKIKEYKIQENWNKLIKIARNCWPLILQPNPFKFL